MKNLSLSLLIALLLLTVACSQRAKSTAQGNEFGSGGYVIKTESGVELFDFYRVQDHLLNDPTKYTLSDSDADLFCADSHCLQRHGYQAVICSKYRNLPQRVKLRFSRAFKVQDCACRN